MRIIKATMLAAIVVAFSSPAFAGGSGSAGCGGYSSQKIAQTTITKTGPQTTVRVVTRARNAEATLLTRFAAVAAQVSNYVIMLIAK